MKRFSMFLLTAFLCLSLTGASASPIVAKAHKTTHKIEMPTLLGSGGHCSGTAIGPHALLTASHCVAISAVLKVDGDEYDVVTIISDGLDHSIYLLNGPHAFADYATVDSKVTTEEGDRVFLFGNPGSFEDMYREGYVSGFEKPRDKDVSVDPFGIGIGMFFGALPKAPKKHTSNDDVVKTYYDFNGFFGDSGSGIFNEQGKVIAVTSLITGQSNQGYNLKFMGGFEVRFTQKQLKEAREFNPDKQ